MSAHLPSETIHLIVEKALNSPRGIEIPFETPGDAIYWRQRYYKVRALILKKNPESDWRTMSSYIPKDKPNVVRIVPTDSQINIEEITEL